MIPGMERLMSGTNYSHFIRNMEIAAGLAEGRYRGASFNDGEVFKWIQGASATLAIENNPALQTRLDEIIATIAKKSAPCAGGKKLARKLPPERKLSGASRIQGLNSVVTISGHSSTRAAVVQNTRPSQAGSRAGGWRDAVVDRPAGALTGTASPHAARTGRRPARRRRPTPVRRRAAQVHAGRTAGTACRV